MDLATRMRDLRVQAGLTKTALAKPRYTVSYVSQIEAGRRTPSGQALAFFAERLGVSPRYLATGIPEDLEDRLRYRLETADEALRAGRPEEAADILLSVRAQAEEYGLTAILHQARVDIARVLEKQHKVQEAIDAYEEALEGRLPLREAGEAVAGLARVYRMVGDLTYAAEVVESFLNKPENQPIDPSIAAELQGTLVSIYFERGDMTRAERCARRALDAAAQVTSPEQRANVYWYTARVLAESRRWEEALEFSTRARVLMEEYDDRRGVARLHNAYAFICLETDPPRLDEARDHLQKAEALLADIGSPGDLAYVWNERGRLALLENRPQEALEYAERALADARPDELERARCLYLKGRSLAALGRSEEAQEAFREAVAAFRDHGARQQEASCWREIAELHVKAGEVSQAMDALTAGLQALEPARTRA